MLCWYPHRQGADAVATNGDPCAIRVILLRTNFTYIYGMAYFLSLVRRNAVVVDAKECVSSRHTLGVGGLP
jgi:hypothetical protein